MHDVMVLVHGETHPRDDEWIRYIDAVKSAVAKRSVRVLLVYSRGGGPNAKQRALIAEALRDSGVYAAICTSSSLAYGITTAIGWIYKAELMRTFHPKQTTEAMAHLRIPSSVQGKIRDVISGLATSIGRSTLSAKRLVTAARESRPRGRGLAN